MWPTLPKEARDVFTAEALLDLHRGTHKALGVLMDHCSAFSAGELHREFEGFGYPTVLLQLHHLVGCEEYWVGVLHGLVLIDERDEDRSSIEAVRAFRERVTRKTTAYLGTATSSELCTPRQMSTWGGGEPTLIPAHVILRTQTHAFQHMGQVVAMCRQLGRPVQMGFPLPLD